MANNSDNQDKIGFVHYSDENCDWRIDLHQKYLVIQNDDKKVNVLLCADSIDIVYDIVGSLCDILRRVRATRAWEGNRK